MNIQEIRTAFRGRLVGNNFMKQVVCEAVAKLPEEMVEYTTKHIWFFSSDEDAYGYAFNGNDLKDKHMIFLSDILFHEPKPQIFYTILHEIGHIILNHKNSIGFTQTKEEIKAQEEESNAFAKKYLDNS